MSNYLDLLEKSLLNSIYPETEENYYEVEQGIRWPIYAHTMVGARRLANVRMLAKIAIDNNIPGDFLEAGVWRGGVCIYLRGILKDHGITDRNVFVADSFCGLPVPINHLDMAYDMSKMEELKISVEQVSENFSKYGLLDNQVKFIAGWFKESLKGFNSKLAILRVDADYYDSTIDVLNNLYDNVSVGGFVIIDDYGVMPPCAKAVDEFQANLGFREINRVDESGIYWKKR